MKTKGKYVCIKSFTTDSENMNAFKIITHDGINVLPRNFEVGDITTVGILIIEDEPDDDGLGYIDDISSGYFSESDLENFVTLAKYRELRINKILND